MDIYYEIFDPQPPNPCCFTITEQLTLGEIVVHNGLDYKRLYVDETPRCDLREENGIVYKYDQNENIDTILIDMNLEVGDVFNFIGSAYNSYPTCHTAGFAPITSMEVENVEFVELAGETRKIITFNRYAVPNFIQVRWVEGIGNIHGFDAFWEAIDITAGQALVCFTNSTGTYFFNDATSCDNTTLNIVDLSKQDILLYPNPVSSTSILQFPEGTVDQVQIFDVSGKLIKEIFPTANYIKIDIMQYASGLYFYKAFSEKKPIKSAKFIIR
ncbi:MAG: T9SS type A sorting domain-containing protein [Flavobacteriaceae bacterium]|nr:T9SS type A sorting domain-containing protein [Flavobacteriaceae bacterium]